MQRHSIQAPGQHGAGDEDDPRHADIVVRDRGSGIRDQGSGIRDQGNSESVREHGMGGTSDSHPDP
jgi:hypothetical protein